jgi:protein O-mannosyl-transferase
MVRAKAGLEAVFGRRRTVRRRLASKPMVITLPFVLLPLDYWPRARMRGTNAAAEQTNLTFPWSRLALEKVPMLLISAASAWITMQAQQAGGAIRTTTEVSFSARSATAMCSAFSS